MKPVGTNSHKGFIAPSSSTSRDKPSNPGQFSCFLRRGALRKVNTGTKCECERAECTSEQTFSMNIQDYARRGFPVQPNFSRSAPTNPVWRMRINVVTALHSLSTTFSPTFIS